MLATTLEFLFVTKIYSQSMYLNISYIICTLFFFKKKLKLKFSTIKFRSHCRL